MRARQSTHFFRFLIVALLVFLSACGGGEQATSDVPIPVTSSTIEKNASYSSPIAISDDDSLLAVTNTLNGTVTLINVAGDANTKLAEIQVGEEPRSVVITPNKAFAYVTNQVSGTVSVIDLSTQTKVADIPVGAEPYGIALTPDAARAYVANSASNSVSAPSTFPAFSRAAWRSPTTTAARVSSSFMSPSSFPSQPHLADRGWIRAVKVKSS